MNDLNNEAFVGLFKDAFKKCFGYALSAPLSETESKHFSNKVFEETGLIIGAKSIKNYSFYITSTDAKQENPSVATLDTLARYVLNAPYTDEIKRKDKEGHYPYWFQYKSKFATPGKKEIPGNIETDPKQKNLQTPLKRIAVFVIACIIIIAVVLFLQNLFTSANEHFIENFHTVQEDSLRNHGWFVKAKDTLWWNRRDKENSHLTLYTLRGDNWADSVNSPSIKNLLLRKISSDCFTAEIQLDHFIPNKNWQQAGILLLEDTTFAGKSLRLSIAYNDFFGGYTRPKEIIIQAINSNANDFSKPEEIAHVTVYSIEAGQDSLVNYNLQRSALRIEKNGNHFRFLYATGAMENSAFKEALSKDLIMQPKYIGIFALQGFVNNTNYIPANFKFFSLIGTPCEK